MTIILVEGLRDRATSNPVGKYAISHLAPSAFSARGTKLQRSEMLGISTSRLAQEKRVCGRVYDTEAS
jgi:hypothetical protein